MSFNIFQIKMFSLLTYQKCRFQNKSKQIKVFKFKIYKTNINCQTYISLVHDGHVSRDRIQQEFQSHCPRSVNSRIHIVTAHFLLIVQHHTRQYDHYHHSQFVRIVSMIRFQSIVMHDSWFCSW